MISFITGSFTAFNKKSSPISKKSPEIQSILKKRRSSPDQSNVTSAGLVGENLVNTNLQNTPVAAQWNKSQPSTANIDSEDSESQNSNR